MSAPPQLEIKFLDIFGDTYHLPGGSILMTADRKLGIPGYDDFLDKYGFKGKVASTKPASGLPGGVATEEEAEFIKYFGVPYIYGPSLESQKAKCRLANYAKISAFLKHRLTTLDAQINNLSAASSGAQSIPQRRFERIRANLKIFIDDMESTKPLPTCDDYKIDYFKDDTDMLNYLTRALYYGLKPEAGTDEHVKCVNLFRDATGADVELQALLQVVKDKRTDGMLSFMEMVGSSLAGLVHKINEDRSFAQPVAAASASAGASAGAAVIQGIDEKIVTDLQNSLADFFNGLDSAKKVGEPLRSAKPADLLTVFTSVVKAAGPLLTSRASAGPGPGGFPASLDALTGEIIKQLDTLGVKGAAKPGKFYNSDYKQVLQDILAMLEKGPLTAATIGAAADKLALVKAFENINPLVILKSYILIIDKIADVANHSTDGKYDLGDDTKELIKLYQILFAIFKQLKKDYGINKENLDKNITRKYKKQVDWNGKELNVTGFTLYNSQENLYGSLNIESVYSFEPLDSEFKWIDKDSTFKSITAQFHNNYDSIKEFIDDIKSQFNIGDIVKLVNGSTEYIIREIYYAHAALIFLVKNISTNNYDILVAGNVLTDSKMEKGTKNLTSWVELVRKGKPEDGEEVIGASAAGPGGADPAEITRLQGELKAAQENITKLEDANRVLIGAGGKISEELQKQLDESNKQLKEKTENLKNASAEIADLKKQLEAAKAAGGDTATIQAALDAALAKAKEDAEAAAAQIAELSQQLRELQIGGRFDELKKELEELRKKTPRTGDEQTRLEELEELFSPDSLRNQIAKLNAMVEPLAARNTELESLLYQRDFRNMQLERELQEARQIIEATKVSIAKLKAESDAAIQAEKDRCADLEAQLKASGDADEMAKLKAQLLHAQTTLAGLKASSTWTEKEWKDFEAVTADKATAWAEVSRIRADLAAALAEQKRLEGELEAERKKGGGGGGAREAELQAQLDAAKAAATAAGDAAAAKIAGLTKELEETRAKLSRLDILKKKIAESVAVSVEDQAEFEKLQATESVEIAKLRTTITTLEEANRFLKSENQTIMTQLASLSDSIKEAMAEVEQSKKAVAEAEAKAKADLAAEKARCAEIQKALAELTGVAGTADPVAAKAAFEKASADVKAAQAAISSVQAQLEVARQAIAKKDEEIQAAAAAAEKARTDFFTSGANEAALKEANARLAERTAERDAALSDLQKAREAYAQAMTDISAAHAAELSKAAAAAASSKPLTDAEKEQYQKRIKELEEQLQAKIAEADSLKSKTGGSLLTSAERLGLEEEIRRRNEEITSILRELGLTAVKSGSNVDAVKAKLKTISDRYDSEITRLGKQNGEVENDLKRARESFQTLFGQQKDKDKQIGTLTDQLKALEGVKAKSADLEAQIKRLTAERDAAIAAAAKPDIAAAIREVERLEAEAEEIKNEITGSKQIKSFITSQIGELTTRPVNVKPEEYWREIINKLSKKLEDAEMAEKIAKGQATEAERKAFFASHKAFVSSNDLEGMKAQRDEALKSKAALESQIKGLQSGKEASNSAYSAMRTELYGTQSALAVAQEELRKVQAALAGAKLSTSGQTTDAAELFKFRVKNINLERQLRELQKEKAALEARLAAKPAEGNISEMLQIIREYIDSLPDSPSKDQISQLMKSIRELSDEIAEKDEEIARLKQELAEANISGVIQPPPLDSRLNEQIANLESQVKQLEAEKAEMQAYAEAEYEKLLKQLQESVDKFEKLSEGIEIEISKVEALKSIFASKGISVKGSIKDISAAFDRYNEQLQKTVATAKAEVENVQARNEELQMELQEQKIEVQELKATIEQLRQQKSVQTFGSLSGMLSTPAFKSATIDIFTQFAGDQKRKAGFESVSNSNIRETLPGTGPEKTNNQANDLYAIKKYYIDTLKVLAINLSAFESQVTLNDPLEINTLANILKLISSPQPTGLYSLNDVQLNDATAKGLVTKLRTINEENYNSTEPVLYLPTSSELDHLSKGLVSFPEDKDLIKLGITQKANIKQQLIANFFNNNKTELYVMYPTMKIGKEVVKKETKEEFIKNIDINLFEIKNNTVRFGRYLAGSATAVSNVTEAGKRLPTLGDLITQDTKEPFFATSEGKLVSRSEIIRIFVKSLLSALESAWKIKASGQQALAEATAVQKSLNK